jgi:hypothetical protein
MRAWISMGVVLRHVFLQEVDAGRHSERDANFYLSRPCPPLRDSGSTAAGPGDRSGCELASPRPLPTSGTSALDGLFPINEAELQLDDSETHGEDMGV